MIQILELFGGIGAPRKALINLGIPHEFSAEGRSFRVKEEEK